MSHYYQDENTKGGRGKVAPYTTTHLRVPQPLKDKLQVLIIWYKKAVNENNDHRYLDKLDDAMSVMSGLSNEQSTPIDRTTLLDAMKKVGKQKKSAKESMAKLVNELFETDFTVKDLQ
jgi:hypothetical protein